MTVLAVFGWHPANFYRQLKAMLHGHTGMPTCTRYYTLTYNKF